MKRVVYACDIGSTRPQGRNGRPAFAWARLLPNEGSKLVQGSSGIQYLVDRLELDIERGYSVALGFEAPLFIPVPQDSKDLSKGRRGEGNRSFASPVGLTACALGVHQSAWILKRLYESSYDKCVFTLDLQSWPPSGHRPVLFCWEAFVSGQAHSDEHLRDAATAAVTFLSSEQDLQEANAVGADNVISLIGAVALWSGWISDLRYLRKSTLVLKPTSVFEGEIQATS